MKTTIILLSLSFFLISCPENDESTEAPEDMTFYTITNNTEKAVAHITYQNIPMEVPSGKCIKVAGSQFSGLKVEVEGKGSISKIDNSTVLCKIHKDKGTCKPGHYSIENDRWLGGIFKDTYELKSSDENTDDCMILSVIE